MTAQTPTSFLEKVAQRSGLNNEADAQRAANVVFRIMRDMMYNKTSNQIEADLKENASDAEQDAVDLWQDYNVMVAFFSRISPAQNLHLRSSTFWLRLKQEGALPEDVTPQEAAKAVFSATKEILPEERSQEIAQLLPDEVGQVWAAA
ncbi:MAG TPA: DUF2267 domain-containing protein [Trichocoleus sp.]